MRRLDGKVAVIAGGGTGIGAATARRLASEGCRVAIGDLLEENAQRVAQSIIAEGGDAIALQFDQADDHSVKALMDNVVQHFGQLDFIHANAADLGAIMSDGDALDLSLDIYDRTMAVNQRGYFLCTRHGLPHLVKSKGAIVYTSSVSAFAGEPMRVAYAMSKSAINALMRHVASRWGKQGVRANAVAPGFVYTDENRKTVPPEFEKLTLAHGRSTRLGETADIAAMVAMLFSADGEWINGQVISVDGGAILR